MPFHLHIPLPGPFSYSRRLGNRSRHTSSSNRSVLFWVFLGWWIYPLVYLFVGIWKLCQLTYNLLRWCFLSLLAHLRSR